MSKTVHYDVSAEPKGYIKGRIQLACGIENEIDVTDLVRSVHPYQVTCEWCKIAVEAKRDEPVTHRQLDERVVNMQFTQVNGADIDAKVEEAIERGIKAGLEKVKEDFFESEAVGNMLRHLVKSSMRSVLAEPVVKLNQKNLVQGGVREALQSHDVRQNLIGIHKIAVDELDEEYKGSAEEKAADDEFDSEIKRLVHEVMDERAESPHTESVIQGIIYDLFNQEAFRTRMRKLVKDGSDQSLKEYGVQALTSSQIYRGTSHHLAGPGVGTQVINVTAEVDPDSFRTMMREVMDEFDEDTADEYVEQETALMQKAVTSIFTSDEGQALVKKLVKEAIAEDAADANKRAWEWMNRSLGLPYI